MLLISFPVRSHPTLEQLESLPVIRCLNGTSGNASDKPEMHPTPPENEDDLNESTSANVELTPSTDSDAQKPTPAALTNGFIKDVDLADEDVDVDVDESRSELLLVFS